MITTFTALFCALFGIIVGSFLNVVICRVPNRKSIVRPGSACPRCDAKLEAKDNIPIVSWLLLRGRCRHCGEPISLRYPLVEAITGLLFAVAGARFGFHWALPAFLLFIAGLLALAFTDLEYRLLPRRVVYVVLGLLIPLLVIASAVSSQWGALVAAGACSLSWYALFYLIHRISPRHLGFGDVRLALVLGLGLGWLGVRYAVLGFFFANVVGTVICATLLASGRMSRQTPVPYGTFLAVGALIAVFFGSPILHHLGTI